MAAHCWVLGSWLVLCSALPSCRGRSDAAVEGRSTSKNVAPTGPVQSPTGSAPSAQVQAQASGEAESPDTLIEVSGAELLARVQRSGQRAVIINAWASWCGPCRREMPMLVALRSNLEPRGIGVELVSVDEPGSRQQAIAFLAQHAAPLPSYIAKRPLGPFKLALNPRWPGMLPASFLVDGAGKLRYYWGGPVYENELLEVVDAFLAGTLVDGEAKFGLAPGKVE